MPSYGKLLCLLARFTSTRSAGPISFHLRFLSTSPSSETYLAVDYLINKCGLSREKAAKASKQFPEFKSTSNADSVLSFLRDFGFTAGEIATSVAYHPKILCSSVENVLKPNIARLSEAGLTPAQIKKLFTLTPNSFASRTVQQRILFWLPLFDGAVEQLIAAVKMNRLLLFANPDKVVVRNIALLQECGLSVRDIAKLMPASPRLLTTKTDTLKSVIQRTEELMVPRSSAMFRHSLTIVSSFSASRIYDKLDNLKKNLGWSEEEVTAVIRKTPSVLNHSETRLLQKAQGLIGVLGCGTSYLARHPVLLTLSLERRLMPRILVLRMLKEQGLVNKAKSFPYIATMTEEKFVDTFISRNAETVPGLHDVYDMAKGGSLEAVATSAKMV